MVSCGQYNLSVCAQYEEHAMMSQLRDMEHREMVEQLHRKISHLEAEVSMPILRFCRARHLEFLISEILFGCLWYE